METTTLVPAIQPKSGELAASASAALAKATIEAKFSIALARPRSVEDARQRLLQNCKRKGFAETAKYKIPRWNAKEQRYVDTEGFSIRFAEAAIQAWGNVDVTASIAFEDDEKRMVRVAVTDLETNISFTDEVVLAKTVERSKKAEGVIVVAERTNTDGKKVFVVKATEDELLMKVNSAKSKSIRTSGLRLLPQDILDEAWDRCTEAVVKGGTDPLADLKRVCDAFVELGVMPTDLDEYLGHPVKSCSPAEIADLRKAFTAVKDGETTWSELIKSRKPIDVKTEKVPTPAPTKSEPKSDDNIPMNFKSPAAGSAPAANVAQASPAVPPAQANTVTPQDELFGIVNGAGVKWEGFHLWLVQTAQLAEGVVCDGFDMLPTQLCESLLAKPKILNPALKMIKAQQGNR